MTEYKVSYAPPAGRPLGTNWAFKIGTTVVIPILNLVGKNSGAGRITSPRAVPLLLPAITSHI